MPTPQQRLIERFFYEGLNKHNEDVFRSVVDKHVRFRGSLGKKLRGIDKFCRYFDQMHEALSRYRCEIHSIIVDVTDNDSVAVRLKCHGVQRSAFFGVEAPSGGGEEKGSFMDGAEHEVSWTAAAFFTLRDGKIVELWMLGDVDNLKRQLGAAPDSSPFSSKPTSPTPSASEIASGIDSLKL